MNETESSDWLAHFRAALPVHCLKLGFYFDNSANTLAGHDFYSGLVQRFNPAVQKTALEAYTFKALLGTGSGSDLLVLPFYRMFYSEPMAMLPIVLTRLFKQILRIKIVATYSRVVGKDLGFMGTERLTDAVVHDFTVSTEPGTTIERVKLKFTQYSQGGVVIGVKFYQSPV